MGTQIIMTMPKTSLGNRENLGIVDDSDYDWHVEIERKSDSRELYRGTTKSEVLEAVKELPEPIQKGTKSFFKGSSNNYNKFAVIKDNDETFIVKMENPGRVPGSKAIYYKIIDKNGKTLRVYKESFDQTGRLIHRKEK